MLAADDFGLFLLVVLPLVTMRVFAEERANGTDELLLTSGLRPWEVALAKHAVTYLFVVLLLAASAIYPAVVVSRAGLGFEHLLALYVGQLCYGCAIASIGLACSSFTASQIVAAVLGYSIPFVLLDFAWLSNAVSEPVARALGEIALLGHYGSFPRGVIELREVLYFAADQKYTTIKHRQGEDLIDDSLKSLEEELGAAFVRIHRNTLVHSRHLERIERTADGQHFVHLRGTTERLAVSRRMAGDLKDRFRI